MVSPFATGKVYLDASVLIYATETPRLFPGLQVRLIDPLARGEITVVTSWITLAEVLVKPLSLADVILETTYRQFLTPSAHLEILGVDRHTAEQAARLRHTFGLKLPDAIHIGTGMAAGCTHFLSGDSQWNRTGLRIVDPANV